MSQADSQLRYPDQENSVSPTRALRTLFLTLFLRGRSARGLQVQSAPKSVGRKLFLTLLLYALVGLIVLAFRAQSIMVLSAWLHAMTFIFLGMFVASSAGEILFNREEADILMHRPIQPRDLLWAKIRVLVEVSLWLALAVNLAGFVVGVISPEGDWRFPFVHAFSLVLEALFTTSCVIMVYQLCLRWFGRERLDGMMTTAQVLISITAVIGGQIVPRVLFRLDGSDIATTESWWPLLLPPVWFAGIDDALAGSGVARSWVYGLVAIVATLTVLWLCFGKLAGDYEIGLQTLNETAPKRKSVIAKQRLLAKLVNAPPLRWWLRDPVERASFLLSAAYLVRDRDVKLRLYPGLAPILVIPFMMIFQDARGGDREASGFGLAIAFGYLGLLPLLALNMLQYSQNWQAADMFRAAPLAGPAPLCHGGRKAILCFTTVPLLLVLGVLLYFMRSTMPWYLVLPSIIAIPVFAIVPNLRGHAVPLSQPTEEAKSAGRGASIFVTMMISMALSGLALWAWRGEWFWQFVAAETCIAILLYFLMNRSVEQARWSSLE